MGENLPTEIEKLRAYSSVLWNLRNIHHAMFPPSFAEKNEKLNSNMSFWGGGPKKKENPLTSQIEKIKKKHAQENFIEKELPPKNKAKHT